MFSWPFGLVWAVCAVLYACARVGRGVVAVRVSRVVCVVLWCFSLWMDEVEGVGRAWKECGAVVGRWGEERGCFAGVRRCSPWQLSSATCRNLLRIATA